MYIWVNLTHGRRRTMSKDSAIRNAINRMLSGKSLDFVSDSELDFRPLDPDEKVLFVLEDESCRQMFRYMTDEAKKSEKDLSSRAQALTDESTIAESKAIQADYHKVIRRMQVLGDIFWGVVKELHQQYDTYTYPSLGVREGWKVVVIPPRGPSLLDLFDLGRGYDPDVEDL